MEIKKDILWRVYLSFIGVMLLSLCVLGRAFYIQRFQGSYWRGMSDSMHQKFVTLPAERGTIYSEDGKMLSTSIPYWDIYMDFAADGLRDKSGKRFKENVDSLSMALADLFKDKPAAEYRKELQTAYSEKKLNRHYLIQKGLTFDQFRTFRNFPLVRLGRNKSGIIAEIRSRRLNPFGMLARRTIGLSRDNAQNVGLERTYDSSLLGIPGKQLIRYIAGGASVPVDGYELDPINGRDIITTIDVQIQDIVEGALMKMMVQSESEHGTCIVMETKTGKIKAIANLGRDKDGGYGETLNYALQTTEPGSTIKLATLLAVLDHGSSTVNDMVEIGGAGHAYVGVRNVNDAERAPKPYMSVKECFAHSSNVGMSKIAYKAFAAQPDLYKNYLKKFHLDRRSGIDLVGEDAPRLPRLTRNKEGLHAMVTASFGYAIEVSPLHTLMLYNAIANNGKMMRPYLVNSIKSNGITLKEFTPKVLDEQLCKPAVIRDARLCMEAVTTEGTAKAVFKDFPFPVGGKTGTAHVAGGATRYGDGVYQASFVGYFPADNPEYTCIVVIKTKPHAAQHFGGALSAPVFKDIATKLFAMYVDGKKAVPVHAVPDSAFYSYKGYTADVEDIYKDLGVKLDNPVQQAKWSQACSQEFRPAITPIALPKNTVPDVKGMTLKDAVYLLEDAGLKVTVKGTGKVVAQDIAAGNTVQKNKKITILLN